MRIILKILLFLSFYFINNAIFANIKSIDLLHEDRIEYKIIHKNFSSHIWERFSDFHFDNLAKGDTLLLKFIIHDFDCNEPGLYISSYLAGFNVIMENKVIYSCFPRDNMYYNQHILRLQNNYKNESIYIQIPITKRINKGVLYSVKMADFHTLTTELLKEVRNNQKKNTINISIISIILFTSVISLLIFFLRFKNKEYQFLFYTLTTVSAITENIDMRLFDSLVKLSPGTISDIEVFSRYSIIVFALLFIEYAFKPGGKGLKMMLTFFIVYSGIALSLYLSSVLMDIYSLMGNIYSILTVISLVLCTILIKKTESYKKLRYKYLFLFFASIFILIVIYTAFSIFYFEYHREAPLLYGILAISFAMLTILISNYIDSSEKNVRYRLELEVQKSEILKLQQANMEVQYEALKSQVNPHFLFNSLNALSALCYPNPQPQKAKQFIDEFSKIFRYVLDVRSQNVISLEKELDFVRSYLFLQRIRFSEGLKIIEKVDNKLLSFMLPPLSLQIIIENAIKHNVISKEKPLIIEIFTDGNKLVVKNNLQPRNKKENDGRKIGQKNISERYALLTDEVTYFKEEDNTYVSIIPLLKDEED